MKTKANTDNLTTVDNKKPSTKQELIAANIKLLIEQLEDRRSDALTNYLTAMSRFHTYSFRNVLEIARQMPEASEEETEEEAEQRRADHERRMSEYHAEQQRKAEERKAEFERQQKEYEAEQARRENCAKHVSPPSIASLHRLQRSSIRSSFASSGDALPFLPVLAPAVFGHNGLMFLRQPRY